MKVEVKELTKNELVLELTRTTVWKDKLNKEPSKEFMEKIYMSEHSPIYNKWFKIEIKGIKSWVATHLVRHNIGYVPYVSTGREDRIEYEVSDEDINKLSSIPFFDGIISDNIRDIQPQGNLVNIDIVINAMSFINVSRKRLCYKAHEDTRVVWNGVLKELNPIDAELMKKCVPNCIYRGFCPEIDPCGFNNSEKASNMRKIYLNGRKQINID